ncbi:Ubiquinone biosynthesis protein COQ7 -like protein [Trichinella zimbabwensis]|uniref:Ubiquinone biosynthesis protein COQ7-like protein n=1 Tax=Trichinella zimbabwensis TaxID=268475 RepID=A0A0V1IA72_9BILA|nr:Ubiquinone biosynthesis protein COQ7 -like protein [Trichinella zimbabwensis]
MWIKIIRGFCTETNRQRMLDRIIRVDHAGELGAARIYAAHRGQQSLLLMVPLIGGLVGYSSRHCVGRNLSQSFPLVVHFNQESVYLTILMLGILACSGLRNLISSSTLSEPLSVGVVFYAVPAFGFRYCTALVLSKEWNSKFFQKTAAYIQFFKGQSLFAIG